MVALATKLFDLIPAPVAAVLMLGGFIFYAQLYTYTGYKYELDMARLSSRWDVWLADYTGKTPNVTFNYNAHQHTSKGSVPGISGNVDLNVTTLNYPKIIRKKGLTRLREGK